MKCVLPPPKKNHRYYLHRRVKEAFTVNARARTVFVPVQDADTLRDHRLWKYIARLAKLGYNIQITINTTN